VLDDPRIDGGAIEREAAGETAHTFDTISSPRRAARFTKPRTSSAIDRYSGKPRFSRGSIIPIRDRNGYTDGRAAL